MTEIDLKNFESFLQAHFNNPFLQLDLRPEWSSLNENHREHIKARLNQPGVESSSISHCQTLGGFVASHKPVRLGFDVEENSRVTEQVLLRMFAKSEVDACPKPFALWCAKEALFKSLKDDGQPDALSQLPEIEWNKIETDFPIYKLTVKNLSEKIFSSIVGYCWIGSTNSVCVWSDSI